MKGPIVLEQLRVTLLKDEILEEGVLNVKDFEIALAQKVRLNHFICITNIYFDWVNIYIYIHINLRVITFTHHILSWTV